MRASDETHAEAGASRWRDASIFVVFVLLAFVLAGCGTSMRRAFNITATSLERARHGHVRGDNDEVEGKRKDDDDALVRRYGHLASRQDTSAIVVLVGRYYAAAARENTPAACGLMYSKFAHGAGLVGEAEGLITDPGAPPLRGQSCTEIVSVLFKEYHAQLVTDAATAVVVGVRIDDGHGLALVGFRSTPERQLPVRREGDIWKIDALFDREIP